MRGVWQVCAITAVFLGAVLAGQRREALPDPPTNLRIVKGTPAMTLNGLTVVLLDSGPRVPLRHEPAIQMALESFLALKELGNEVRIFAVSDRLIELKEIPETFATFATATGVGTSTHLAVAVNRVNITRPRRIVVLMGHLDATIALGSPREGTRGYVWAPAFAADERRDDWQLLDTSAAGVVRAIMHAEGSNQ